MNMAALLGVNIDHVATLRQARGTSYPDPVNAALICEQAGAEGITLHLREDRRHIQDDDVRRMRPALKTRMNLELAVTDEMIAFAKEIKPHHVCFVPEKRQEVTTEGGLDVVGHFDDVKAATQALSEIGCDVSLFIDADFAQIDAAVACGAPTIEIHTGAYADAETPEAQQHELERIVKGAEYAASKGLVVNAGHGLNLENVTPIAQIDAAIACGAPTIEIHTGAYADAETAEAQQHELERIIKGAEYAASKGLVVNAGHGLNLENVTPIAQIPQIHELNIGHSLIADAIFVGLEQAVREMKAVIKAAR